MKNPKILEIVLLLTYAPQLVSRLYGEKSSQHLKVAWVPLIYSITTDGTIFNWVAIWMTSPRTSTSNG
jgi:hypothetical protein